MSAAYCTVAEITTLGINPQAVRDIEVPLKAAAIAAISDKMDGYLSAQFKLPLVAFGADVHMCCAILAAAQLLRARGYDPDSDPSVMENVRSQEQWLRDVSRGIVRPQVTDSSPSAQLGLPSAGPRVLSAPSRGFSRLTPLVNGGPFGNCGGGGSFGA